MTRKGNWLWECIAKHPEIIDPYLDSIAKRRGLGEEWLEVRAVVRELAGNLPSSLQGWLVPSPKLAKKSPLAYAMFDRLLRGETYAGDPNRSVVTAKVEHGQTGVRITFPEFSRAKLKNVGYKASYDHLRIHHARELWDEFERDVYDDTGWKIEELRPGNKVTAQNYRGDPIEREVLDDASKGNSSISKVIFGASRCALT